MVENEILSLLDTISLILSIHNKRSMCSSQKCKKREKSMKIYNRFFELINYVAK